MVTPADVWQQVVNFMGDHGPFAGTSNSAYGSGAFHRIFRSSAELALRGQFEAYLSRETKWETIAEYKMACLTNGPRERRKAGDLAIFPNGFNASLPVRPDVVVELKHHSSLQPLPTCRPTKRGQATPSLHSMECTAARELFRWHAHHIPAIHLAFFTEIYNIDPPLKPKIFQDYSFLKTYLPAIGSVTVPTNWGRLAANFWTLISPADSFSVEFCSTPQSITVGASTISGKLHVVGVWFNNAKHSNSAMVGATQDLLASSSTDGMRLWNT